VRTKLVIGMLVAGALCLPPAASATQVYVTGSGSTGNSVSPFSVGSDGSLTPISCGSSCTTGTAPIGVAMTPNGQYLYTANASSASISAFSVGSSGSLTPVSCSGCTTGTTPYGIAVSPSGQYVYTANQTSNTVSPFSIGSDGALTAISCSGTNCNTGTKPYGVAVTPNGQYLYTANATSATVSAFSIGSDGAPTSIACGSCTTGTLPEGIAISPNGQYLYTANRGSSSGAISVFSIGSNGSLTSLSCGTGCNLSTTGAFSLAISPNGSYLYATVRNSGSPRVAVFSIGSNGLLTPVACSGTNCNTGTNPGGVAVTPASTFAFASVFSTSKVNPYSIGSDGALTPVSCSSPNCNTAAGPDFQSVVVSPDQGPTAAFRGTAAGPGQASSFDASISSASAGQTVERYDWDFGDGQAASDAGPTPTHTYSAEGDYTVTLTVTDDAGCSTTQTFTGQTVSCNGSSVATTRQTISVKTTPPVPPVTVLPCPSIGFSVANYTPGPAGTAAAANGSLGPTVPGVRARISVAQPSQLQIEARLRWNRNGQPRTVGLGGATVVNSDTRNLRLALPDSLTDDLPRGTSVILRLRVTAYPLTSRDCIGPTVDQRSLRTQVGKVLANATQMRIERLKPGPGHDFPGRPAALRRTEP
jgi:DNA-binding beta-propeller fold protein YncE